MVKKGGLKRIDGVVFFFNLLSIWAKSSNINTYQKENFFLVTIWSINTLSWLFATELHQKSLFVSPVNLLPDLVQELLPYRNITVTIYNIMKIRQLNSFNSLSLNSKLIILILFSRKLPPQSPPALSPKSSSTSVVLPRQNWILLFCTTSRFCGKF